MTNGRPEIGWIPEDLNPNGFQTVHDLLSHCCKHYANKPAFSCMGQSITYQELDTLSAGFANFLQTQTTLKQGDRVAVQLPNVLQYPIVLFGILRAGMVAVNTNPLYTPHEMEHQFSDSGAKALIIYQSMAHNAEKVLDKTQLEYVLLTQLGDMHSFVKRHLINFVVKYVKKMEPPFNLPKALSLPHVLKQHHGQPPEPITIDPSSPAVLQYTGGTTGVAKGAVLTHANLLSNTLQGLLRIEMSGPEWSQQVISPLPLYHIYAFTMALAVMHQGGHSVLVPNPRDIPGFIKELKKYPPTAFFGLNTLFVALCNNPDFATVDFSRFKITCSGGMALTHDAAEQWHKVTDSMVVEGYGLTETSPVVSVNIPGKEQIGTIGTPVEHTQIRIIDTQGNDVKPGDAGELCVWGPQVMAGYWQREDETNKTFTQDGYFKTGDIALQQDDGMLRIVDRAKDLIIVSGFNVYPNEVEDAASKHPDIVECAAVGIPDDVCGETVKLFAVRSNPELTEADVRKWCRKELTSYKVPKTVEFADDLPKSNVGKILRRELRPKAS